MPTATCEAVRSYRDRLNSRLEALEEIRQTHLEKVRQAYLEKGAAIITAQQEMWGALQGVLCEGMEREAMLGILAGLRAQAERVAESFASVLAMFKGDAAATPVIEAQLRQTEGYLASVRDLEARVSVPVPPFDESRLAPAPDGLTAEGYVRVSDDAAWARGSKKP